MRDSVWIFLTLALFVLRPGQSHAQTIASPPHPSGARLLLAACASPPYDTTALIDILRIELLVEGITLRRAGADGSDESDARILVDVVVCAPNADEVTVRIERPLTDRAAQRTVHLGRGVRRERSRVVALAAAELLRDTWNQLAALPSPSPSVTESTESSAPPPSSSEPSSSSPEPLPPHHHPEYEIDTLALENRAISRTLAAVAARDQARSSRSIPLGTLLEAELSGRTYPAFGTALIGAQFGVEATVISTALIAIRAAVDGSAYFGRASDPLGRIDVVMAAFGASLLVAVRNEIVPASIGPRIEIAWAHAQGRPFDSTAFGSIADAPTATLSLRANVRLHASQRARLSVALEIGYVILGLDLFADHRLAAGVGGPMIGLGLGGAIDLSSRSNFQ